MHGSQPSALSIFDNCPSQGIQYIFNFWRDIVMTIYVVQPNDTVDTIAESYQVPVDNIIYINQLAYPYALAIGQALLIPTADDEQERRSVITNGYAYPFINQGVLESTLPYLTNLSIFSYGFTGQGELIPPALNDTWMIEAAAGMGVNSILTLTPMDAEGRFSNILIHQMVNDEEAKNKLIQNILVTLGEKGYQGVDVDFEYILAEDRDAFTSFVAELTEVMNENGYETSVALAPKTSSDQKGLLYEGKDYRGLGAAANSVLLMTYEWGYTYYHVGHR